MRYERLLSDAWRLTWHNRWLWLFGLFAGGVGGGWLGFSGADWGAPPRSGRPGATGWQGLPEREAAQVQAFVEQNATALAGAIVVLAVLALALVLFSFVAQGAVIGGAADIAEGRPASFGIEWRRGLHSFGRLLLLALALAVVAIGVAAVVGMLVAFPFALVGGPFVGPRAAAFAVLVPLLVILANVVAVIVAFAQRAVVVDEDGPLAGLRYGWTLLREHPGTSLVLWLVGLAASVVGGIALGAAAVVAAIPAGLIAGLGLLLIGMEAGLATLAPFIVAAGAVWLAVFLFAAAGVNTFLWAYWTLAYLRLTGRAQAAIA